MAARGPRCLTTSLRSAFSQVWSQALPGRGSPRSTSCRCPRERPCCRLPATLSATHESAPLVCGLGPRRRSDKRADEPKQGQEDPEEEHPTVAPFQRPDPERDQHHEIQKSAEADPPPHGFLLASERCPRCYARPWKPPSWLTRNWPVANYGFRSSRRPWLGR